MAARGVSRGCIALALLLTGCSGDDTDAGSTTSAAPTTTAEPTTTTAPERPASTTTTAFDPASVEGAVEAAYLRSWDVYAEAVYNLELDEKALAEVYAADALDLRLEEIQRRIDERRAALVDVEHEYQIVVADASTANVIDGFVNHQVLIDPDTKVPIEADPNEQLLVNFSVRLVDGTWRVVFIQKVTV